MYGFSDEYQIKTKDGWKYFHEIEIDKDELYCWKFEEMEKLPDRMIYAEYRVENHRFVKDSLNAYVKPLKKHFYLENDCDLYQIKSYFIDVIVTSNYKIPCVFKHFDYKIKDRSSPLPANEFYEIVKNEPHKQVYYDNIPDSEYDSDESESEELQMSGMYVFSEMLIKHSPPHKIYRWSDLEFKLNPSDVKKIDTRNTSIVNFTMPELQENFSWKIYLKKDNKEFCL